MKILRKNKKKRDCVVVAAYNAASWCNLNKTYKEIEKVARSCGYNDKKGTYYFQFDNLVKKLNLPAKRIKPRSLNEIENRLYKGRFFIFLYTELNSSTGHAVSAFVDHAGRVILVNPEGELKNWFEF